jgi:hypothetical protein
MSRGNPLAAPGALLLAPVSAGPRATHVLCVFDWDPEEPGALFALILNQPGERPAQPLAFGIFECHGENAWWGPRALTINPRSPLLRISLALCRGSNEL